MKKINYFIIIISLLLFCLPVNAAKVVLNNAAQSYDIGKNVEIFEDKEKNLTIEQISSPGFSSKFIQSTKDTPNYGFTKSAYWIKIELENNSQLKKWLIEIGFTRLNYVTLYIPKNSGINDINHKNKEFIVKNTGISQSVNEREIKSRHLVFELPIEKKETVFLKIVSERSAMQFPLKIISAQSFLEGSLNEEAFFNIFYGMLIALMLYNFIIFLILRDKSYFYYCLFCFSALMHQMSINGHGYYYIWTNYQWFNLISPWVFSCCLFLTSSMFVVEFLELKKTTLLYKLSMCSIYLTLIQTLLIFFYDNITFNLYLCITFCLLSLIPTFFYVITKTERHIKIISFAWSLMLLGGITFILNRVGLIPKNFFTDNLLLIILCSLSIVISIALAEKFKIYKNENNRYYKQLEEANIELSNYKNHLEELVNEKTRELEGAKNGAENVAKVKSDFLATMSHEIRTPMNAVIGMSELLSHTELTKDQNDLVDTIRASGEILLGVINDILDFSKIESGKMELEKNEVDIRKCIENIIEIFSTKANEKEIELLYNLAANVPEIIITDITRLNQIFINLVNNALKFTEKGEILINVKVNYKEETNCELLFSVVDTGIGIPEDKKDRIFKSFSQVDSSVNRKYGGTGLGLTISKNISQLMGGDIWFENNFDKGVTFNFTLKAPFIDKTNDVFVNILKDKKVAVIADNATVNGIINDFCKSFGMIADSLTSFSNIDGYDLCIFSESFSNKFINQLLSVKIPVIIIDTPDRTRNTGKEHIKNYFFIAKPLKKPVLYETIISALFDIKPEEEKKITHSFSTNLFNDFPFTILIAEDNLINQKLVIKVFDKLGYKVDIAVNGLEAVNACKNKKYDIIFMDIQMPEMDGLEATKVIKKEFGENAPEIIGLTANVMAEDRITYINAGMSDCLGKPFKIKEIEDVIKKVGNKYTKLDSIAIN